MSLPEYEYRGLIAEAWDVLRGDTSNWADRYFYLDQIRRLAHSSLIRAKMNYRLALTSAFG